MRTGENRVLFRGFCILLVASSGLIVRAQEIRIRVLDGRNGKPIAGECLNIWTGTERGDYILAKTNREGVVALHMLGADVLAADSCRAGWFTRAPADPEAGALMISGDYYVACQEYAKIKAGQPIVNPSARLPAYPIKQVLASGLASANTCGKFRAEAGPGELIFFVRPRTFLERMRQ